MIKKFYLFFIVLAVFCGCLSSETSQAARNSGSIQIKGSDTMVNLAQAWAEEFMKQHPDELLAVTGGGSGTGIASLISGTCDIAITSRQISEKEKNLASKKGVDAKEYQVGLDGLAVVVHPSNTVEKLTQAQLADIFMGKITNWKEVGGADLKIVVLSREVNSGTHVYFKEHILRKGDSKSKEEFTPDALLLTSSQAIADEIKQNTGAIGYYGMGYIGKDHKALAIAKDESSDYFNPTIENVLSNQYPISRPLFVYTNGSGEGKVKVFLDYILSEAGQVIVAKTDFVPLKK